MEMEAETKLPYVVMIGDSLTTYSFYLSSRTGLGEVMQEKFKGRAEVLDKGKFIRRTQFDRCI
jgi:hypothetical protein